MATSEQTQRVSARLTLTITNVTKVAGVALGAHEGFSSNPDVRVMALAAFMMAGAQVSEGLLLALVDRVLGTAAAPPAEGDR